MTIWGTLRSKTLTKRQLMQYLAEHLAPSHSTLVCRGTLVVNHWSRSCEFPSVFSLSLLNRFSSLVSEQSIGSIAFNERWTVMDPYILVWWKSVGKSRKWDLQARNCPRCVGYSRGSECDRDCILHTEDNLVILISLARFPVSFFHHTCMYGSLWLFIVKSWASF